MATKIPFLTEVPFYPVRKDPPERFDTLIKAAVDGGATQTRELNASFIPAVNKIVEEIENAQTSVAADKEQATEKAGEAAASAQAASASASSAKASQNATKTSETNAKASETAAKTSETKAKASETAAEEARQTALVSAEAATQKAEEAGASANDASESAEAAFGSKNEAKTSETNAKKSEQAAKLSETNAKASEANAKSSENAAKASETKAAASESKSLEAASRAETAAESAEVIAGGLFVPLSRKISAGAGLSGGGDLTADRTLSVTDVAIGGNARDLASARGQIGDAYNLPSSGFDLDTAQNDGIYGFRGAEAINNPTKSWCTLFVNSGFHTSESHLHRQTLCEIGLDRLFNFQRSLKNDGTWTPWSTYITTMNIGDGITINNSIISVPEYEGATASTHGTSGLVPPAAVGKQDVVLHGSGEWKVPSAVAETFQNLETISGATTIDLSAGNVIIATIGGATAFSFKGLVRGKANTVLLKLTNAGSATITWPGVKWAGGAAPTLTAAGLDVIILEKDDDLGWMGILAGADVKFGEGSGEIELPEIELPEIEVPEIEVPDPLLP